MKVTTEFLSDFEAIAKLSPTCSWSLSFFKLEWTGRALPFMHPAYVTLVPMDGALDVHLWPRQRQPRKPRQQSKKNKGGEENKLDGSDEASADEEDDIGDGLAFDGEDQEEEDMAANHELMLRAEALEALSLIKTSCRPKGNARRDACSLQPSSGAAASSGSAVDVAEAAPVSSSHETSRDVPTNASTAAAAPAADPINATKRHPVPAMATCLCTGGRISFHQSKQAFEAHCSQEGHFNCVLTRSAQGRRGRGGQRAGGRPLGFLCMWLRDGHLHDTKSMHWEKEFWTWSYEERAAAREALAQSEEGRALLALERPKDADEADEPLTLRGMT
eukprot:6492445-Amphidinium_carterae.2